MHNINIVNIISTWTKFLVDHYKKNVLKSLNLSLLFERVL